MEDEKIIKPIGAKSSRNPRGRRAVLLYRDEERDILLEEAHRLTGERTHTKCLVAGLKSLIVLGKVMKQGARYGSTAGTDVNESAINSGHRYDRWFSHLMGVVEKEKRGTQNVAKSDSKTSGK